MPWFMFGDSLVHTSTPKRISKRMCDGLMHISMYDVRGDCIGWESYSREDGERRFGELMRLVEGL